MVDADQFRDVWQGLKMACQNQAQLLFLSLSSTPCKVPAPDGAGARNSVPKPRTPCEEDTTVKCPHVPL